MQRLLALVAVVGALLFVPVSPAAAHPFGDPQTITVALDPARADVVRIRWKAGGLDDLTLLGVSLGVLPEDRVYLDGAVFYEDADATALGPSSQLSAYLLDRITVADGDEPCAGTVQPPSDLARAGVTVDYACPGPVGKATVGVRTLTDLHPAYQTLATGPGNQRAVYRDGEATHDWVLGDVAAGRPSLGRSAAVQIGGVALGALLVVIVLLAVRRRRGPIHPR
ncbi:hypothetical protein Ade02nite_00330 [Paractinoplanes deccanensis]|uniref:Uncharacterized protein n=1 Tax=Paractinoplanes deccanensis TaxID=113561 RepID=A0ABQ3XUR8_9ACTN|nr:hypothetical protein [Actinoplanes deccanensis]GID71392.1 hypothetical protein Ade02nite_00330 [Actinoplanes deccanensis]